MNCQPCTPTRARNRRRTRLIGGFVGAAMLFAACGDDDSDNASVTPAPAVTDPPSTTAAPSDTGPAEDELTELCALAMEMAEQDMFPTADQLTRYQALAPPEIAAAVDTAAAPMIAAGDDPVALFIAFATDDVEAAIDEINAWETEQCDVPHDDGVLPDGASEEIEEGATRVDVTATDFAFTVAEPIAAGRTSFVLANDGQETHFLEIVKLAEGVDLETAMASEDDSNVVGYWSTGLAAPGGDDEEVITFDLEPGTYGFMCWVSTADGTPHAMMGMTQEITVS